MSEEGSIWISLAEKIFGLILIILSVVLMYFTATSTNVLGAFTGIFAFLGLLILVAGSFLIVVKPPE